MAFEPTPPVLLLACVELACWREKIVTDSVALVSSILSLDECILCRTIVAERQKQLASLYFVAKDKDETDRFEAGFRSSNGLKGEVNEGELAEFVKKYADLKG